MIKSIILFIFFCILGFPAWTQELPRYVITVEFDPDRRVISGNALLEISKNHSVDLNSIRIDKRSGGLRTDFIDRVEVTRDGRIRALPEFLKYHQELADELHAVDRVHTYGRFYIADLAA